ncbi:hypothetical protein WSM22_40920 [Cytophagales bacterium WSM2-2]|nr:hypothetical protein WSM22_40920 [Cytophagales bacterium WSM2-2]
MMRYPVNLLVFVMIGIVELQSVQERLLQRNENISTVAASINLNKRINVNAVNPCIGNTDDPGAIVIVKSDWSGSEVPFTIITPLSHRKVIFSSVFT